MAYYTKTLEACHPLTEIGKQRYQEMLEHEADMILLNYEHPLKWLWFKLTKKI